MQKRGRKRRWTEAEKVNRGSDPSCAKEKEEEEVDRGREGRQRV